MPIIGAHALLYSSNADALRATFRDKFGFKHVDAGGGWLIFTLPPAELGVHPLEGGMAGSPPPHSVSFMCDDIHATVRDLRASGVTVRGEPRDEGFGITAMLELPGGTEAMLYQPRHPVALDPGASRLQRVLTTLLSEVLYGPGAEAYFLNKGDRGLLASLNTLSAETASARPGGRSSVASHVDHLRYGLSLMNRFAQGENPWNDANWAASWTRQQVTDAEWQTLRAELAREAQAWTEAMKRPGAWNESELAGAVSAIPHLAYHLGAIRQLAQAASGPKATD